MFKFTLILLWILLNKCSGNEDELILIAKKRSAFLEKFRSYSDIAVSQVKVPELTSFVSFKISAEPFDLSIFGCRVEKVDVYIKKASIPVLNPDNSKNPKWSRNITNFPLHSLHIWTDKKFNYVNITSPDPGLYYIVAFFPYVDPNSIGVKQKGLSQQCTGFINILAYISEAKHLKQITQNYFYYVNSSTEFYKFYVKSNVRELIFKLKTVIAPKNSDLVLRLSQNKLPSANSFYKSMTISLKDNFYEIPVWVQKSGYYFLNFELNNSTTFQFSIEETNKFEVNTKISDPNLYKTAILDYYFDQSENASNSFKLYELIKESGSESFLSTFNIKHENDNEFMVPVPLNLTSQDYTVLKFHLDDIIDVGGTFEFSIDFRPPSSGNYGGIKFNPSDIDQIIIGCLSQKIQIPTLPQHCLNVNGVKTLAPVVLNNTIDNSTVLIPFPESGTWYASLKLFCTPCRNCECYNKCSKLLQDCVDNCECNSLGTCSKCSGECKEKLAENSICKHCNCTENCEDSHRICNSSIMFDLSSFPCVMGKCGRNGKCQFMVADGYIFSACHCWNKYRGFDCNDNSNVDSFCRVVIAQILLITSNLIMLPCSYLAFKRRYFSESFMYGSVLFFSSFYHACDVSDYKVQFCISSHGSLQFGDFFSALLSIWATLLAISDLKIKFRSVLHVIGAIILAYFTVMDRTGIWVFLIISIPGILAIGVNWYLKYRKFGRKFVKLEYVKYHFSTGVVVMGIGVSIFAFLQTSGNYMYLHSIWHLIVGCTVLIILPRPDTFPKIFPDIVD